LALVLQERLQSSSILIHAVDEDVHIAPGIGNIGGDLVKDGKKSEVKFRKKGGEKGSIFWNYGVGY
jgi:hypothetical protein